MTITDAHPTAFPATVADGSVEEDLYRDIHKAIRAELFAVTVEAGRLDPADEVGRAALAAQVHDAIWMLRTHAEHEDGFVQPALERHLPMLAASVAADHLTLEPRMDGLQATADRLAAGGTDRATAHALYLDLSLFSGDYLRHQDLEERAVMPALEAAIGVESVRAIHQQLVGSIPPEEMGRSLSLMIPAMNVDDRTELLAGMQQGAPPEVFAGVWGLVGSVLAPADVRQLASRLHLA